MNHQREVLVRMAESVDVEFKRMSSAASCSYLVEIGELTVHLFNVVLFREVVGYAF